MPIRGRRADVDYCIADLVAALNAANIVTVASCCGHGGICPARVSLEDGRELYIANARKDP
jgi:tRNA(Phe) wybutosine-synthesizing methylase Tyw3